MPDSPETPAKISPLSNLAGRIRAGAQDQNAAHGEGYSRRIRLLRLLLPMLAISLLAVVFSWNILIAPTGDGMIPADQAQDTVGRNELLNPRFESRDEQGQPYTITATRAVQGASNNDLIVLESPVADILLNSGRWLGVKAQEGGFRQDSQRLVLNGDVRLYHDRGYQMSMEQLHIDMTERTAWSEVDVQGQGPAGTIRAKGMRANNETGHLVFTGPLTLTLETDVPDETEERPFE